MVVLASIAHQSHAYARERLKEIKNQLAEVRAIQGSGQVSDCRVSDSVNLSLSFSYPFVVRTVPLQCRHMKSSM